jgi:XTP/dITP diphosphohydrolase
MKGLERREALFISIIGLKIPRGITKIFKGSCEGRISARAIGSHGFGFDPIFIPKGISKTFAQMNTSEKNLISHRGKALEKLVLYLKRHFPYSK